MDFVIPIKKKLSKAVRLYFLSLMLVFLSLRSLSLSHPVSLIVVIILQTIAIAALAGLYQNTFWFRYILFLIFLGGILVLFSYITSLASNYIFKFSFIPAATGALVAPIVAGILLTSPPISDTSAPNLNVIINKFYLQNFSLTFLLVIYLLIALLAVVNITKTYGKPLQIQTI